MKEKAKKKFDYRSFISFGLLFSFIIMSLTGIVLYITPPGRVAKWVKWALFGLEKEEWQAVHTIFSYFFLVLGIFHVFSLNWKIIVGYIRKRVVSGINRKRELIASLLVVFFLFFGTLFKVQPLQGIMDIGEYFTESWENKEESAPISHMEEMTISEISKKMIKLSPELIIKKMTDKGIRVDENKTLKKIGEENNKSPFELYKIISENEKKKKQPDVSLRSGRGMGRMAISEIAAIFQVDLCMVISGLRSQGIISSGDDRLKAVAERSGLSPMELAEKIKGLKNKKEIK